MAQSGFLSHDLDILVRKLVRSPADHDLLHYLVRSVGRAV
jgi:hypothetical protein